MTDDTPPTAHRTTSVNLVRTSNPWTQATSAAGFVLRYLVTVRKLLVAMFGSPEIADECVKTLLSHLVSSGFGEHQRGRLRDFLFRAIRSIAKSKLKDLPESKRQGLTPESLTVDQEKWLTLWRAGLLERSWRALERFEHKDPSVPVFSVLHCATTKGKKPGQTVAQRIESERGVQIEEDTIQLILPEARAMFAQFLADEVAETLEKPSENDVKAELQVLGLTKAFDGIEI